ncbi:MAG: hypothetical protein ACUVWV_10515 [Thermodesulfobacteriota bacterium]
MAIRKLKNLSAEEKEEILAALQSFLQPREEIILALLFGSTLNPLLPGKYGDIDLALYVAPEKLKYPEFILEARIEAEAYQYLSNRGLNFLPLEVVIINQAPYSFLAKLLKGRYLILKKEEETLTNFIERVSARAMANSFFRSQSLQELLGN